MKIIKKVLIILTIIAIILPTIYSNVFAATSEQKAQVYLGIAEYMEKNYPNIQNEDLSTRENQAAIRDIALQLKKLCKNAGISVEDMKAPDTSIGWPGVGGGASSVFTLVFDAVDNPNLEEQVKDPAKTEEEKEKLANEIKEKAKNLGSMTTKDLLALDALLGEFSSNYPESFKADNPKYGVLFQLMFSIQNEIVKRNSEGDPDIPDNYKGTIDDHVDDVNDREGQLTGKKDPTGLLGNADPNIAHTPDEIIGEAQNFKNSGTDAITINGDNLKIGSDTFYNILLSIGIFLAIAIGMYLGVKFMLSNAEDKAKVKEALIPYIAGCIVIFSAFIIWKVAILLLSGIK